MKEFNPMQYIAIDISNCYGLDKLNYEDRIQWVKDNLDDLENLEYQAEEPFLYYKAVRALRAGMAGEAINHHVALDSVCSGLQLMSVVMRDINGCMLTGLIDPDNRTDAYTLITDEMNRLMKLDGIDELFVTRKQAKEAVMTGLYGSIAVPKRVFGETLLPYFNQALANKCPGAIKLLGVLRGSWNSETLQHSWYLPDGHYALVPIMETVEKRINIPEINYTPVVRAQVNQAKEKGISNIANVVHSLDAYVLRSLVRRCNYSKPVVEQFMDMSKSVVYKEVDTTLKGVQAYLDTKMADLSVLDAIDHKTIKHYPESQIQALRAICEQVLQHKPFELIVIHDSFACHPNNCNHMRRHYNEILAELSDSNTIYDILGQLYGSEFGNTAPSIAHYIRNSNYGIC